MAHRAAALPAWQAGDLVRQRRWRPLGDRPQEVPDRRDNAVVPVDDAESDEPAQHRLRDQQPNVDRDYRADEAQEGIHLAGTSGGEWQADRTVSRGGPQG